MLATEGLLQEREQVLVRITDSPSPSVRLVAFAYAGMGPALFRRWQGVLPPAVEILAAQPPGREARLRQAPLTDVESIVDEAVAALQTLPQLPLALFGASLGALLAFETARRWTEHGRSPVLLCVAASPAPSLHLGAGRVDERASTDELRQPLAVDAFLEGIPDALRELTEPVLRADLDVYTRYRYQRRASALRSSIFALAGTDDSLVPRDVMASWAEETDGGFALRELRGDHFFVERDADAVLRVLAGSLFQALGQ